MRYVAPSTIDEVRTLLSVHPEARVFAGATDLLPQSRAGRQLLDLLVDLKGVARATSVEAVDGAWRIGAATPAADLAGHAELSEDFPGLTEAVALIGSNQVQNRASLGGNVCNASPAADSGGPLFVNGARVVVAGSGGFKEIPIAEFMLGPGRTALASGEFVVEFLLDRPGPRTADAYLRFTPRTEMDIAVVGAAARVMVDAGGSIVDARLALAAVAPIVVLVPGVTEALAGRPLDEDGLTAVAALARDACRPIDDKRGTKEFRTHVAGVMTTRVLRTATERARGRE
ncbi:MAG: FAD binding domain-containing protein [Acidimicrobiia bacterium]